MKFLTTSLFTILLNLPIFSQIIAVEPENLIGYYENVDLIPLQSFEHLVTIENLTEDSINLKWTKVIFDCSEEWRIVVKDKIASWGNPITTNINSNTGLNLPLLLAPLETFSEFQLDLLPDETFGCCNGAFTFALAEDPENILATVNFDFRVNDENCNIVSTEEAFADLSNSIYPNPTKGLIKINNSERIKGVRILDVSGQELRSIDSTSLDEIDISNLSSGVYLLEMILDNGTRKVTKIGKI